MKTLRAVHLYLGCAFAPLLVFYIFSGFLQTFDFHEAKKNSTYQPPRWAVEAGSIHKHQRLQPESRDKAGPRWPMQIVATALCVGSLSTVSLGVMLAWQMAKQRRAAMLAMSAGVVIPIAVLWLQTHLR